MHLSLLPLVRTVVDLVFPPTCLACQKSLQPDERHLCASCWASIPRASPSLSLHQETRAKLVASSEVDELVSAFVFEKEGALQALAHALKYDGFVTIGHRLGSEVGEEIRARRIQADLLIPIPLHRARKRERGFNQAEVIARGISGVTGIPLRTDLLKRARNTRSRTKLTLEERSDNMKDAFFVPASSAPALKSLRCILVDDVITTGATIVSAARVLRNAGAQSVAAASAALAE